jgi:hypothetical protein
MILETIALIIATWERAQDLVAVLSMAGGLALASIAWMIREGVVTW